MSPSIYHIDFKVIICVDGVIWWRAQVAMDQSVRHRRRRDGMKAGLKQQDEQPPRLAAMQDVRRILAIQVTRIGDTVLVTPSLRALATAFPEARIDVLGHPKRVEVLQHLPFLHRVAAISKKSAWWRGWGEVTYDLALVWGQDEALVRYALRSARAVVACRQKTAALNDRLMAVVDLPPDHAISLAAWQLQLLHLGLGLPAEAGPVEYTVSAAESDWARQYLRQHLPSTATPVIGLTVATFHTMPHRDWPIDHFVRACLALRAQFPAVQFLLIGADQVEARAAILQQALGSSLHVPRHLRLRESAALLSQLDLYLGLDTGPSHLAAAIGIPMVALFHCLRRGHLVLSPRCPENLIMIDHPCATASCSTAVSMAAIAPEDVVAACCRQLQRSAS